MDNFEPQSGGMHLKEGHEESDLSVRGIILFGVFLAVGGFLAFVLMIGMIWGLEKYEQSQAAKLTPMEQQLQQERQVSKESKALAAGGENRPDDWYGRGTTEGRLLKTFKAPRLQYDDEHEMSTYRTSEDDFLKSTFKDSDGNIHIPITRAIDILAKQGLPQVSGPFLPANQGAPSAQYPTGIGQAAPSSTGAVKK